MPFMLARTGKNSIVTLAAGVTYGTQLYFDFFWLCRYGSRHRFVIWFKTTAKFQSTLQCDQRHPVFGVVGI